MARKRKVNKKRIIQLCIVVVVVLFVLLAGFFTYRYFFKPNNYLIQNKYYGFKLQTPRGWVALERADYSEEKIAGILEDCKNNKKTNEVGEFRFFSQRYPQDLDISQFFTTGLPSGMILEIIINCTDDGIFQNASNKYINISSTDKPIEQKLRQRYAGVLDKIISSFSFVK